MKEVWIYGNHAVLSALKNPKRSIKEILLASNQSALHGDLITLRPKVKITSVKSQQLDELFGMGAVHQGIACLCQKLPEPYIDELFKLTQPHYLIALDQVTDPHNIGAILRSCATFAAAGIIATQRHFPEESPVLAKAASGALELVPIYQVNNLAQTLNVLKTKNYWCYGLSEQGHESLRTISLAQKCVFILGSEGKGLRRLTQELCDIQLHLPTSPQFTTLNVSNACAITLYEAFNRFNPV